MALPAVVTTDPLLQVRGVSVRYGAMRALNNVDLDIEPGQIVALAGENGAGKSTLVRCIAGDLAPTSGTVWLWGRRLAPDPRAIARQGVAVVWQDLALCENLDVASNLLLGRERRGLLFSASRFHAAARTLLDELRIPISDTAQQVSTLSGGQRQLVAVARAMRDRPQLLILDEPTAALGVAESAQVEDLTHALRERGTTILLVSHDVDQMFRLAQRIVVLRHGRVVADLAPGASHPDDVLALLAGQEVDGSARSQLSRLHGLSGQLASADPSSSLPLILSALGQALDAQQLSIHVMDGPRLRLAASLGLSAALTRALADLPAGRAGGPVGVSAVTGELVIEPDVRAGGAWAGAGLLPASLRINSSWSLPFPGSTGVVGVVTVFRSTFGRPPRDEVDLANLYTAYAASAVERDQLLAELTARNRVLETIQEVLETLAGPVPLVDGLAVALGALRTGLGADDVTLVTQRPGQAPECRARVTIDGAAPERPVAPDDPAVAALTHAERDGRAYLDHRPDGSWQLAVRFPAPAGPAALVATWPPTDGPPNGRPLIEDAANSLRLALEREESERAHRETTTLRRSQELQRQFLSRLSHELRTPLTAIRGYASSLMQTDVTWDGDSQARFLSRISAESARLGRLVDDLLDFSAIESSILRLQPDWCDLGLVIDAARACLPPIAAAHVEVRCPRDFPPIWADHDRLEQVFVNLLDNAVRHNPPGTRVVVAAGSDPSGHVTVTVTDDGTGIPADVGEAAVGARRERHSPTAGAGLGLSIAKGIVDAHGGRMDAARLEHGSSFSIWLPMEQAAERD